MEEYKLKKIVYDAFLLCLLKKLRALAHVYIAWIRDHDGHGGNVLADRLANQNRQAIYSNR